MNLILNRDFKMPEDGWYQLAPLGEFPHAVAGVIQVVDGEACVAMAARFAADAGVVNFAGLLVDFDHFSLDDRARSEAAGWIVGLEARGISDGSDGSDASKGEGAGRGPASSPLGTTPGHNPAGAGLWAQIRWSDVGEAAVKGGRYRFLSPVWARSDCVDLGNGRVRPVRLLNAAVTNDPNLKGLMPLANATPVDRRASITEVDCGHGKEVLTMKRVIEMLTNHLGIPGDATEEVILEKMQGLPAVTALADLQNSLKQVTDERDAMRGALKGAEDELVNRDLAEFEGVVTEKTKTFWTEQLMANRAAALVALTEFAAQRSAGDEKKAGQGGDPAGGEGQARKPLHNRALLRSIAPPGGSYGGQAHGGEAETMAGRIRNRAHEIAGAEKIPFIVAFRRAEKEAAA